MEQGEVFTPLSDITGQNGAPKVQKPTQQLQQQAAQTPRATIKDPDKAMKAGQVHFKAAHGIIVGFFSFILYVRRFSFPATAPRGTAEVHSS
jgi:phosphatidylinositol glycan class O